MLFFTFTRYEHWPNGLYGYWYTPQRSKNTNLCDSLYSNFCRFWCITPIFNTQHLLFFLRLLVAVLVCVYFDIFYTIQRIRTHVHIGLYWYRIEIQLERAGEDERERERQRKKRRKRRERIREKERVHIKLLLERLHTSIAYDIHGHS